MKKNNNMEKLLPTRTLFYNYETMDFVAYHLSGIRR